MPWHRDSAGRSIQHLNRARRTFLVCLIVATVVISAGPVAAAPPKWVQRIDEVVGNDPVSVVIGFQGEILYHHNDWVGRAPASNEKLLLSMALLDRLDPATTIPTRVLATDPWARTGSWTATCGSSATAIRRSGPRHQGARHGAEGRRTRTRARPRDGRDGSVHARLVRTRLARLLPHLLHRPADRIDLPFQPGAERSDGHRPRTAGSGGAHGTTSSPGHPGGRSTGHGHAAREPHRVSRRSTATRSDRSCGA